MRGLLPMTRRDLAWLGFLAGLLLIQFAPILFTGKTYFLGDLTYFYHPWRALPTDMSQRGVFPLWDPYAYLGMPLLAIFQTGTLAPGTLPFLVFPFALAYKLHLLLHHGLGALFVYLWLRRAAGPAGAAAAAAAFSLGGFFLGRLGIINVTGTLAWGPAFFLFARRPILLGLAMACSLLSGYPQIWAGLAASVLALPWAWRRAELIRSWALGTALALGISAAMLLPGLELISHSDRKSGTGLENRTVFSLKARDLPELISPSFIREKDAAGARYPFWNSFYIGFAASALALAGLTALSWPTAGWVAAFVSGVGLISLGRENPLSLRLWESLAPLRYLRYPANFAYLFLPALLPLVALALKKKRWAGYACLLVGLELLIRGFHFQPTIKDSYFADRGPLVERLQAGLGGHRYAFSPKAARWLKGEGRDVDERYLDVKRRLYGSANLPYHLPSATSQGESMLFSQTYAFMDFLFTRPSARDALAYLPWADVKYLLAGDAPPAGLGRSQSQALWHLIETEQPRRARWVSERQAALLDAGFAGAPRIKDSVPLSYGESREDRFSVKGQAPAAGWVLVANPFYPGWQAFESGQARQIKPALGAFQRVAVGPGPIRLDFIYRPASFFLGSLISVLSLACAAALSASSLRVWRRA